MHRISCFGISSLLVITLSIGCGSKTTETDATAKKSPETTPDNQARPSKTDVASVKILDNPDKLPIVARMLPIAEVSRVGKFHRGTQPNDALFSTQEFHDSCRALVIEWSTNDQDSFAEDYRFPSISGGKCHPGGLLGDNKYYPVAALAFANMVDSLPIVCVIERRGGTIRSGFIQGGGVPKMMWPIPHDCSKVSFELPDRKPVRLELN